MEAHSSQGYSIAGGRIPILIALKKISDLKPHEETVAEDLNKLVNALKDYPVLRHPIIADRRTGLSKRRWYATIEKPKSYLAFPVRSPDPYEMVRDSHGIEMAARKGGVKITYQDNKDMETGDPDALVMSTIRIEKKEVVETVKKGRLFPPKSTRHLVPSRPLGGGVPIDWLQGSDFSEAQSRYQEYIQSRKVTRLPEGSRVGSRRYLEEVFLFE